VKPLNWIKKIRPYVARLLPKRLQDARRILTGYDYTISYDPLPETTYSDIGCTTIHNPECVQSDAFLEAFERGLEGYAENERWKPTWISYICCWAGRQALDLEGDFVECGVWKGSLSRAVLSYTDNLDNGRKNFWLFDTFDGFVETYLSETERQRFLRSEEGVHYSARFLNTYDIVKEKFKDFPNVKIIKGSVPGSLKNFGGEKVCYLSIDMNCVYPEIEAISFFWDKLVPGAVVILDDYNWMAHIEQKKAFDMFAREHGFEVLALPTGQGLIFKK
jgi:hypothetical protein